MRKLKLFFAALMILVSSVAFAQNVTVKGVVTDPSTGETVPFASVVVKGTMQGTSTDAQGAYSISAPSGATLVISSIGYKTVEVAVAGKTKIDVELNPDSEFINETIVVAFGTTTKKSYTGSASVLKSEDISQRQASNVTNTLAGQVAGVQGLSNNGQPGTTSTIYIRGLSSINASNTPLYVIDGIPAAAEAVAALPNSDIESVSVLKDAASSALYGARGANGVVMITTKKGSTKDAKITLEAKWGGNSRAISSYDVMRDPGMYYEKFYEALYSSRIEKGHEVADAYANQYLLDANNGGLGYQAYTVPAGERLIGSNGKLNPNATLGYVDPNGYTILPDNWYDELFNKSNLRQEYTMSISGSSDKITYFASGSYLSDTGLMQNSDYKRASARLNVEYQAKEWLKFNANMSYSHADQKYPDIDAGDPSSGNLFYVQNNMAPIYPLYVRDSEGKIMKDANGYTIYDYGDATFFAAKRAFMNQSNPASSIEIQKSLNKKDIFTGKWSAIVEPIKGLKAIANFGVNYIGIRYNSTLNPYYGQFAAMGGAAEVSSARATTVDQQYLITYTKGFGKHNIDLLAGYNYYKFITSSLYGYMQNLFNPEIAEVSNAILQPSTGSSTDTYFTQGFLAQAKYDYDGKYYVSASYRRDASSRFAKGHQWGNFWSAGAAWDIKQEAWLKDVNAINLLKLKVSYGAQGNDALGNYHVSSDLYTLSENNGGFATTLAYKGNEELTWETNYNLNFGVDFSFFNDRLSGTVEGWRRRTVDMLYNKPVAPSLGYSSIPVNIGSLANTGIDAEINGVVIKKQNVKWSIYANLSHYVQKILELSPELNGKWIEGTYIRKVGSSLYNRYMREYAGVNPDNGNSMWYMDAVDANGNTYKTVTENWSSATQYETGDLLPKMSGGFGTKLELFGFDLSVAFNYQLGGKILDTYYSSLMHSGYSSDAGHNWHMDILNSWTPENTNTNIPRVNSDDYYTNATSTRFLVSSNYLNIQNITLGYTLPSKWTKKIGVEKIRFYGVADNVAMFAARKGLDPRLGFGGSSSAYYSPIRSISGGLSVTF